MAVIGGGIIGCAAAALLAERGASVELFERDTLAGAASGRNSGAVQHPFDPVLGALYGETVEAYQRLGSEDVGFGLPDTPAGVMMIGPHAGGDGGPAPAAWAREIARELPELRPQLLEGDELRRLEPLVAPDLVACRIETGYPVRPAAATLAYAELARRRGARLREHASARPWVVDGVVQGVIVEQDAAGGAVERHAPAAGGGERQAPAGDEGEPRVPAGVGAGRQVPAGNEGDPPVGVGAGRQVSAGAVLVAAGPWTPALVDRRGAWRPVTALWGVVAEVDLPRTPGQVLERGGVEKLTGAEQLLFSLIGADGVTGLGSTFSFEEPDPSDWVERLRTEGRRFVPALADAPIRGVRACARPLSFDNRPLIGGAPGVEGLWVACGNGPWGISTGPATARIAADAILGTATPPGELDAGRFGAAA